MAKFFDSVKNRMCLKKHLQDGYSIKEICEEMEISLFMIREELKKGMSEDDYMKRKYQEYDPFMATEKGIAILNNRAKEMEFQVMEYRASNLED